MKTKLTLLTVLMVAFFSSQAQQAVTNGGFETWKSASTPTDWTTYEDIIPPIAGVGLTQKDTVDKYAGTSSVKVTSKYVAIAGDTIEGVVSIGTGFFNGQQPLLFGAPFTSSPDTLEFAYKYAPVGNDTAGFEMELQKPGGEKLSIGGQLFPTAGQWGKIIVPLRQYYTDTTSTTDTLFLAFYSSYRSPGNSGREGSALNVDAVRFGYKTAPTFIENINNNLSVRVFPNPADNLVNIQVSEPVNNASIIVYDMTGRVITHEFGGSTNFELVTSNWESGIYSYSILSGGVVVTKGRVVVQH